MSLRRIHVLATVSLLTLGLACASSSTPERAAPRGADSPDFDAPAPSARAWDQAAVTSLAKQLPKSTGALYDAIQAQGQLGLMPSDFGAGDAYESFQDSTRQIRDESMNLAAELAKGASKEKTMGTFERIMELFRDVEEEARAQYTESDVLGHFDAVRSDLEKLDAYYGVRDA